MQTDRAMSTPRPKQPKVRRVSVFVAVLAFQLFVLAGASEAVEAWGSFENGLRSDQKSAWGRATELGPAGADFRVSAACTGPDRHSHWEDDTFVTIGTGKCYFWRTASYSYIGLRE